jgi:hypothetical protein
MHILIACEAASIASSMRDASRLGRELAGRGHRISYVMGDPVAFAEYGSAACPDAALAAPLLREPPELVLKRRSPSGFEDVMASAGFANSVQLQALAKSWIAQLELLRPDAIVGFSSPLLWLVGPCFASTFAAGSGDQLPPVIGAGFPRMSAMAPPLAADHLMVANANAVLRELDAEPISELTDILNRTQSLLYGIPWLDPYLQLRQEPSLGMLSEPMSVAPIAVKKRYAAVLDVFSPHIEALLLGIAGADDFKCEIFLAGATAGMTRFLQQQPNVTVVTDLTDLMARLREMSGLIHYGEADLSEVALSAGVPQLVLPFLPHQSAVVGNFQWMGCAMFATVSDSIPTNAGMVRFFANNHSLAVHARHHARQMHAKGIGSAMKAVVQAIEAATPAHAKPLSGPRALGLS